jgi:hypothetical protein
LIPTCTGMTSFIVAALRFLTGVDFHSRIEKYFVREELWHICCYLIIQQGNNGDEGLCYEIDRSDRA